MLYAEGGYAAVASRPTSHPSTNVPKGCRTCGPVASVYGVLAADSRGWDSVQVALAATVALLSEQGGSSAQHRGIE